MTSAGSPTAALSETGALPSGVTFVDNGDGRPPWPARRDRHRGTYPLTITASNGVTPATQSFTLTVNAAPAITSADNTTFTERIGGGLHGDTNGAPTPALSESGAACPAGSPSSTTVTARPPCPARRPTARGAPTP